LQRTVDALWKVVRWPALLPLRDGETNGGEREEHGKKDGNGMKAEAEATSAFALTAAARLILATQYIDIEGKPISSSSSISPYDISQPTPTEAQDILNRDTLAASDLQGTVSSVSALVELVLSSSPSSAYLLSQQLLQAPFLLHAFYLTSVQYATMLRSRKEGESSRKRDETIHELQRVVDAITLIGRRWLVGRDYLMLLEREGVRFFLGQK